MAKHPWQKLFSFITLVPTSLSFLLCTQQGQAEGSPLGQGVPQPKTATSGHGTVVTLNFSEFL